MHDLVTGEDRVLTNDGSRQRYAEHSVISPDGKKVAYARYNPDGNHYELRVADATKDVAGPSIPLYSNQEDTWLAPLGWSHDGKWIAVWIQKKDHSAKAGLVSAFDGSFRLLRSAAWADSDRIAFSPDSRFVALSPENPEGGKDRDVIVMPVDGNRESAVVRYPANDKVVGWSPDGRYLLFSSDRTGSMDLWGLPMANGESSGSPVLLRSAIGNITPLGVSAKGALILAQRVSGPEVYVASIDFQTGKKLSEPVSVIPEFVSDNAQAVWSPDGKQLAYVSRRRLGASSRSRVCVLSLGTGQTKDVSAQLNYYFRPRWSPDGKQISVNGADRDGNQGVFLIDVEAASTKLVVASDEGESIDGADWSADGAKLYFRRAPKAQPSRLVERDLASGAESTLLQSPVMTPGEVSPDGQWAVVRVSEQISPPSPRRLLLKIHDGEVRELKGDARPIQWGAWSPDSRSFFVPAEKGELLRYDVSGGEPQKVNLGFSTPQLEIHPDGKRVAYRDGRFAAEVWALENFLPRESAAK